MAFTQKISSPESLDQQKFSVFAKFGWDVPSLVGLKSWMFCCFCQVVQNKLEPKPSKNTLPLLNGSRFQPKKILRKERMFQLPSLPRLHTAFSPLQNALCLFHLSTCGRRAGSFWEVPLDLFAATSSLSESGLGHCISIHLWTYVCVWVHEFKCTMCVYVSEKLCVHVILCAGMLPCMLDFYRHVGNMPQQRGDCSYSNKQMLRNSFL